MNPEQRIAVLEATVVILKERIDKQDERISQLEKVFGDKLDTLLNAMSFVKGSIKVILTLITIASPFVVKYIMG